MNIDEIETEALKLVEDEKKKLIQDALVVKLRAINAAKKVLANLEHEYEVLKADLGA